MDMIIETIRQKIQTCGLSRYEISRKSGVAESQLSKVMAGGELRTTTADLLCKFFGLELREVKRGKSNK